MPSSADLFTQELHIAQAFELCRKVLSDKDKPDADRAIALCWILHLLADGHQPCHGGSLYAEKVFPDGDRGGNSIKMGRGNMHATWDGLLGGRASANDVRRRVAEQRADKTLVDRVVADRDARRLDEWVSPVVWLEESREVGRRYVYAPEVMESVTNAMRGISDRVEIHKLSDGYFTEAGEVARYRAVQTAYRLVPRERIFAA